MLILTGLFFNKKGNQSFYNSVIGYTKSYKVTIVTAATLNSEVYLELENIKKSLPQVEVFSVYPYRIVSLFSFFLSFLKKLKFTIFKNDEKAFITDIKTNTGNLLVNMQPTIKSKVSFYSRSYLLAIFGLIHKIFNKVDVICCYEINGCIASVWLKKLFSIPVFIKLQGTALGGQLDLIGNESFNKVFSIDITEIKRAKVLDLAIMTNDGTRGDVVLKHYGFPSDKILFLNNGIDSRFKNARRKSTPVFDGSKLKSIKLCSVSRLTAWKRVDLILMIISELKKEIEISYSLIGIGDENESQAIIKLIKELSLEDNVSFIRGASTEEVISIMSSSDCLISINKFTNVSNPVFEALYIGIPVITIKQTEFLNVLGPGMDSCLFVVEGCRETLVSDIINEILSINSSLYNKLISNSESFRGYFPTWEIRSNKELNKILSIIK